MTTIGFFQPAVFAFAAGMALVWTAAIGLRMRRDERSLGWMLLAAFAAAQAAAEWCVLATAAESSGTPLRVIHLGLSAAGFISLVEFGRRELRGRYRTLHKPWVYAPVIAVAAFKLALNGLAGLEAVCGYVLAPLGGLLAAGALAQRARTRRNAGWGLPLAAAAIAFFAIGSATSVPALRAFAALGLLIGIWRERRDESPFSEHTGALLRWRAPGAFIALMLLGCAGLSARGQTEQGGSAVVQVIAAGEAADATTAAGVTDTIEIDPRQLARERAAAERYKQGLSILVVVVVVAVVWVGLAHLPRMKS